MRAGLLHGFVIAAIMIPAAAPAQLPSWTKHAAVTTIITVAGQVVMKEPWLGGALAVGLNAGHEVGQARTGHGWTADSTHDLVFGSAGALLAAALLQRYATRPKELRMLGLRPLTPPDVVQATYENLAHCFDMRSSFDRVRWYTSANGSLSHRDVVVLAADSLFSVGALTRSLLPVFGRKADAETLRALEACPANRRTGAGTDAGDPERDGMGQVRQSL